MSRSTVIFFQSIVVLMGVMAIYILIQYPLIEGRMQNLDLLSIYLNPLVLYGYASSSAFFVGLYHVSICSYIFNKINCLRQTG